jgi:hypothetical protein
MIRRTTKVSLGTASICALLALTCGATWVLAACSSSNSGGGGGGSSSSGSSSSGSSSGTTSSSSSSSSSGSSSGSSSSSSGAGTQTEVVSGLPTVTSLIEVGSTLYWVETGASGAVMSVSASAANGTPQSVYANANLDGNLCSDGTLLYVGTSNPSVASTIVSMSLTGANVTTVSTDNNAQTLNSSAPAQMFAVGGNLYYFAPLGSPSGFPSIDTMPITSDGGASATDVVATQPGSNLPNIQALLWADTSGLYYSTSNISTSPAPTWTINYAPLSGTPTATVFTEQTQATSGTFAPGSALVLSGTAYVLVASPDSTTAGNIYKTTGGAAATALLTAGLPEGAANGSPPEGLAGDANGLFAISGGGIGAYTLSGTQLPDVIDSPNFQNALVLIHASDANNVYYVGPSSTGTGNSIWAIAR